MSYPTEHSTSPEVLHREKVTKGTVVRSSPHGPRTRIAGTRPDRRRLTEAQELHIQVTIRSLTPAEAGLQGNLWDRISGHALVHAITGIDLPQRTFSTYLDRWGLIAPRPMQTAHAMHPALVKQWMMRDHPVIAAQARDRGAQLLWLDVHTLAPLSLPVAEGDMSPVPRTGIHLIFLANGRGHQEWQVAREVPLIHDLLEFIERAMHSGRRRLHLIIRDRRPFVDPVATQWLTLHQDLLEVYFLPDQE